MSREVIVAAHVVMRWKDTEYEEGVGEARTIEIGKLGGYADEDIFFHCEDLADFQRLLRGEEDFTIMDYEYVRITV